MKAFDVIHNGARDDYQVAKALYEIGRLGTVYTDFYTPDWMIKASSPFSGAQAYLRRRYSDIPSAYFHSSWPIQTVASGVARWRGVSTIHGRRYCADRALAHVALRAARRRTHRRGVFCYSYHWHGLSEVADLEAVYSPRIVFQVHPISHQIRRVLLQDRMRTGLTYSPDKEEIEAVHESDAYLASLHLADQIIVTSRFTARGLSEFGIQEEKISIIPYGNPLMSRLDAPESPRQGRWSRLSPLKLLWVGRLDYRKGSHHLLEALKHFPEEQISLTIVTRSPVPDELHPLLPENVIVRHNISDRALWGMYQSHHLFVLPSLIEGFGLVYMEALSAGLPVLCTHNTGGADIITHGSEGFVVPPGNSEAIQHALELVMRQPSALRSMSRAAFETAGLYTWSRFRGAVQRVVAGQ